MKLKNILKLLTLSLFILIIIISNTTNIHANTNDDSSSVTVGDDSIEGGIKVVKSARPKPGEYGTFIVDFEITGKSVVSKSPICSIMVLDHSYSMIVSQPKQPDGSDYPNNYKWDKAKQAVVTYMDKVSQNNSANKFILTTFSNKGKFSYINYNGERISTQSTPTEFSSTPITVAQVGSIPQPVAGNGTALFDALWNINNGLNNNSLNVPDGCKPVIVILSDGSADDYLASNSYPYDNVNSRLFKVQTPGGSYVGRSQIQNGTYQLAGNESDFLKYFKNKAEIFTIGYDLRKKEEITEATEVLKNVATSTDYYLPATVENIGEIVEQIAKTVSSAAEGAVLEEVPNGDTSITGNPAFTLKRGDGKTTLAPINETAQHITYELKIDKTLPTNSYPTNNTDLTKITLDGKPLIVINESPIVNWVRPSYGYTVNYYKDSIDKENLFDTETQTAELTTRIPYDTNKVLKGYEFDRITGQEIVIEPTESNANPNVLNVIYKPKTVKYDVYYHYEQIDGTGTLYEGKKFDEVKDTNGQFDGKFGQKIEASSYIIAGNKTGFSHYEGKDKYTPETLDDVLENRLDIYYIRNDYGYTVNYYFDDVLDQNETKTGSAPFESEVSYTPITREKFILDTEKLSPASGKIVISNVEENNIINVYYKRIFDLTIKKEVKVFNDNTVLRPNDYFNFKIEFNKDGKKLSGNYQYKLNGVMQNNPLVFTNGIANISLRSTDNITIVNLDRNINYKITETLKDGYVIETIDATGDLKTSNIYNGVIDSDSEVTFINTYGYELAEAGSPLGLLLIVVVMFLFGTPIINMIYNFNLDRCISRHLDD